MQINLTVPQGAATGAAVPVSLTIGTAQSPSGVTIEVQQARRPLARGGRIRNNTAKIDES
jgi:hypothetical protein